MYFCNIKFKFNNLIKIQHYGTEIKFIAVGHQQRKRL